MDGPVDILAIETSCDETAAAVVRNGREILSDAIYTQIAMHTEYGGVVPELASRKHIEKINTVVETALRDAGKTIDDVDAVAVTYGPGLVGALLVGVSFAKGLAWGAGKPLIGVNHIAGHINANYIEHPDLVPPYLCLVVSGGHTHMVLVRDYTEYEILGRTVDDAAGEAFDKVARAIGLGYPGGPKIDKAAKEGDSERFVFPKAKVNASPYDFSFSGLKSAVLNTIHQMEQKGEEVPVCDLAASFQKSVVDVLAERLLFAANETGAKKVALAGGVSANSALRGKVAEVCEENGLSLYVPSPRYCTDNAVMIGAAAYHEYMRGNFAGWDLNAVPGLSLS